MSLPTLRVKLTRPTVVGGQDGKAGDEFEVSRIDAALLVGDGSAVLLSPEAPPYTVRVENPTHADPAPRRVAPAPTPVTATTETQTRTGGKAAALTTKEK